jgi:hypothetical protein
MMEGTEFQFKKGARVRLRDSIDPAIYGHYACSGNEGWIADIRRDPRFGLPEVYIHWDQNHWTYNGVPDRWTFQEHFELADTATATEVEQEEPEMSQSQPDDEDEYLRGFREFMNNAGVHRDPIDPYGEEHGEDVDTMYNRAVEEVHEALEECESFVVIGVTRRDHPSGKGVLVPISMAFSKNPESGLLALSSTAKFGAEAHQKLVIDTINALHHES